MAQHRSQPGSLPPTDHVARVLLKNGARDEAVMLLRAAIARDPGEKACAALLRAVQARPDAAVYGPDLDLNLSLVSAYARSGMLLEALAVLRGARLEGSAGGSRLADMLRELLQPCPDGSDAYLQEVDSELRTGGATIALTMLDQRMAAGTTTPDWARRRHALLQDLLFGSAERAPSAPPPAPSPSPQVAALVEHVRARDLRGALRTVCDASARDPSNIDAAAAAEALGRLVPAIERAISDQGGGDMRTQPMTGVEVGLFQLKMGNLEEAERVFRKVLMDAPADADARQSLDDLQTFRRLLEGRPAMGRAAAGVDPLMETMTVSTRLPEARDAASPSEPEGDLPGEATRRARPASMPEAMHALEGPTKEMKAQAEQLAASEPNLSDALEGPTKEVRVTVPKEARRAITSPELLRKKTLQADRDGYAPPVGDPSIWDDPSTEVGSPEDHAELLLQHGYFERALDLFERLHEMFPERERLEQRVRELRQYLEAKKHPATARIGQEDLTKVSAAQSAAELDAFGAPTGQLSAVDIEVVLEAAEPATIRLSAGDIETALGSGEPPVMRMSVTDVDVELPDDGGLLVSDLEGLTIEQPSPFYEGVTVEQPEAVSTPARASSAEVSHLSGVRTSQRSSDAVRVHRIIRVG